MRTSPRASNPLRIAAALLVAAVMSGCSFSWDSSGIRDVLLGGRKPSEIAPAGEPVDANAATNADAAAKADAEARAAAEAQAAAESDDDRKLTKLAILPVAYVDPTGSVPCDLCPPSVQMKSATAHAARLTTGFIYEAIARHPRILFLPPSVVDRAMAAAPTHGMRETAAALAGAGNADLVVAAALVELRPRVGPDDAPESTAGVTLYVSLVDARSGEVKWSDTFDDNESGRNWVLRTWDRLAADRPIRFSTAEGYCEYAVDELIEDLVDELD
jgi:hypothetical protein